MKKRVVCFGDSNTWGYSGENGTRFDEDTRWTGVLSKELGSAYTVIEEGQNGRTTVWDDPVEGEKNGLRYLVPCLESHAPLDLLVIMLGTNDLKHRFCVGPAEIAQSVARLVQTAKSPVYGRGNRAPMILLMSPVHIGDIEKGPFFFMFNHEASARSKELALFYKNTADELGCAFFDAAGVAVCDRFDYVHIDPQGHAALGKALAKFIGSLL